MWQYYFDRDEIPFDGGLDMMYHSASALSASRILYEKNDDSKLCMV